MLTRYAVQGKGRTAVQRAAKSTGSPNKERRMSTAPQASELQHVAWPATKEGWLNKQSEGGMLGKKFQKRWFVLNGHSISYSHNPGIL